MDNDLLNIHPEYNKQMLIHWWHSQYYSICPEYVVSWARRATKMIYHSYRNVTQSAHINNHGNSLSAHWYHCRYIYIYIYLYICIYIYYIYIYIVLLIKFLPYSGATAQARSAALWGVSGSYGQAPAQQGMSGLVRETSHLWLYSSPSQACNPF